MLPCIKLFLDPARSFSPARFSDSEIVRSLFVSAVASQGSTAKVSDGAVLVRDMDLPER